MISLESDIKVFIRKLEIESALKLTERTSKVVYYHGGFGLKYTGVSFEPTSQEPASEVIGGRDVAVVMSR